VWVRNRLWLAVVEDGMRHLVIAIGALAVLLAAGSATGVLSTTVARFPAEGGPCSAQPPGCGSAQATAKRLAGWAQWTGSEAIAWVVSQSTPSTRVLGAYSWVPGSLAWTAVPGQPDDDAVPFGTSALLGGRVLFLGGDSCWVVGCPAQSFFDGAWFDASSGTWTYLPEKFSGGLGPAVWTGSAMVVFATKAGASTRPLHGPADIPAGAAAAFDPSTGAWTDLARCPIPDLANASLAWTGRQLIVVTMNDESGGTPQVEVLSRPVQHST